MGGVFEVRKGEKRGRFFGGRKTKTKRESSERKETEARTVTFEGGENVRETKTKRGKRKKGKKKSFRERETKVLPFK